MLKMKDSGIKWIGEIPYDLSLVGTTISNLSLRTLRKYVIGKKEVL